ncbi:MAG: Ribosomal large subunit pseudouridine synthase B [Alphaproteobacteria bacterium MarineAlpha3_Bin5]|nr:pseudouridine synthase [Magnetovibrio sp.]PPR80100.1 MAG: Ribosomal large subunit pseudouridine synthase B [Alphaproteobacteria bacterium MarineAlpha3_Bin5]|tara:strand:+ start:58 stop:792 length:735 start_codon:yes stop_codon:yes gene_type:complete
MSVVFNKSERIAKVLARAGLCSRREAERWIDEGRVAVNNNIIWSPALVVQSADQITVNGDKIPPRTSVKLWRYYKPAGLVTTHNDPEGRPTVFENLPKGLPRLISVGRLDLNSEGLLLLSNDGDLTQKLEQPINGMVRRYRVRVFGKIDKLVLQDLKKGITVNGIRYGGILVRIISRKGSNSWLSLELKEGKNREVRKVMLHLGLKVNRLIRVSYGPFDLKGLVQGDVKVIPENVLKAMIKGFQ